MDISLDTIVSVLGIVIPLIGSIIWLARKLDRIEGNTQPIKTINETMIRLDERTLGFVGKGTGTVVVTLQNLGTVSVSASLFSGYTQYSLQFQNPIKLEAISRVAGETGLDAKEKGLFGGVPASSVVVNPNHLIVRIPSTDPTLCSSYISMFLKWLSAEYFNRVQKTIAEYENIKV